MRHLIPFSFSLLALTSCKAQKATITKTFDVETFDKNKIGNEYKFITNDSTIIEQGLWHSGYDEIIRYKESYIQTYNKYYETGRLKLTGDFYPNDFEKGVWKEYDEQGNLVKETDYDAPYKFTWDDILKLIKDRKLDMTGNNFEVGRNIVDKRPVWSIIFNIKNSDKLGVIGIYGDTGEIFQESEMDAPADGDYDDE